MPDNSHANRSIRRANFARNVGTAVSSRCVTSMMRISPHAKYREIAGERTDARGNGSSAVVVAKRSEQSRGTREEGRKRHTVTGHSVERFPRAREPARYSLFELRGSRSGETRLGELALDRVSRGLRALVVRSRPERRGAPSSRSRTYASINRSIDWLVGRLVGRSLGRLTEKSIVFRALRYLLLECDPR